jgi:hypothetical protein
MAAVATSPNGTLMTSCTRSCGIQRSAFDMNAHGRRIVHAIPDARRASSELSM